MRLKTTTAVLGAAALGSAFLVTGGATAAQVDSATGGGQIIAGTDAEGGTGPGSTIAFTARQTADGARGQVQYVERATGQPQTVKHGEVTCIAVMGNTARIAGLWRDAETEDTDSFTLVVQDNGAGDMPGESDDDMIAITTVGDPSCEDEQGDDDFHALARGNAQVRDNTE